WRTNGAARVVRVARMDGGPRAPAVGGVLVRPVTGAAARRPRRYGGGPGAPPRVADWSGAGRHRLDAAEDSARTWPRAVPPATSASRRYIAVPTTIQHRRSSAA